MDQVALAQTPGGVPLSQVLFPCFFFILVPQIIQDRVWLKFFLWTWRKFAEVFVVFLAKNDCFWGKEFWTTTICSTVFISTCIQYSLYIYIYLFAYICLYVYYTFIQNLMIPYGHFYRAGRHYFFGTTHIGLISSHKAGQGQDPSAVVDWALLSDMAQILMKKSSGKWLEFIISNKSTDCTVIAISCCILIPPGLGFLSEIVNLLIHFAFWVDVYLDVSRVLPTAPRHFPYVDQGWELFLSQTIGHWHKKRWEYSLRFCTVFQLTEIFWGNPQDFC